jgi:hypothetical protein
MFDSRRIHHRVLVLLLAGLVLALAPAFACDDPGLIDLTASRPDVATVVQPHRFVPIRIDARAMAFDDDDDPIELAGVDFAIDGGVVLVLSDEDTGFLGNAVVPAYPVALLPEDALGRVLADEALHRMELVTWVPGGVTIVFDDVNRDRLLEVVMARLAEIGCCIDTRDVGTHAFTFSYGDQHYRAVFGTVADGARMYVGM